MRIFILNLLLRKMKKGVFIAVFLLLAGVVSAGSFDNLYYKICADSSCRDSRVLFEIGERTAYIRAFEYGGIISSGELLRPGETNTEELDFSHFFGPDDYVRIRLDRTGIYRGVVRAEADGEYIFEKDFEFNVVNRINDILDLSQSEECSDVQPLRVNHAVSGLVSEQDELARVREYLLIAGNARSEARFDEFISGVYNPRWECPSAEGCGVEREIARLHTYFPNNGDIPCGGFVNGQFEINGEGFFFGSKEEIMQNVLSRTNNELLGISEGVVCSEGCTKKIDLGVVSARESVGGLFGTDFKFGYEISCVRVMNPEEWKFETQIKGRQECIAI